MVAVDIVTKVPVDIATARVYEHGWQSWSPTTAYALTDRPRRPATNAIRVMSYRPERDPDEDSFQGEGLLCVQESEDGPAHVFGAAADADPVPSISAVVDADRVVVSADGPVEHVVDDGPDGLRGALARWGDRLAAAAGAVTIRPAPTLWCSWYYYWTQVTEADVLENVDAMDRLELPIDVVQLDDGYQTEIGDWLSLSGRFESLEGLASRIRAAGRQPGIWVAPFLVGERSRTYAEHPDWLVGNGYAGHNWDQDVYALDATHPGANAYLREVFATLHGYGFDFFKIDFIYAGAIEGGRHGGGAAIEAYREGLRTIRAAIGDSYLLGCGAPILPSVGLVDAMRVSPDVAPHYDPLPNDPTGPSQAAAVLTGSGRAWQHGRLWVNDPDCLLARPQMERREDWALHVERHGGLRGSSDRLRDLDQWGLDVTRRLLTAVPPAVPFPLG